MSVLYFMAGFISFPIAFLSYSMWQMRNIPTLREQDNMGKDVMDAINKKLNRKIE